MPKPALIVEHISKRYRLGALGAGANAGFRATTLREELLNWWRARKGNGEAAKAPLTLPVGVTPQPAYCQALDDVSFTVSPGEVLGIVGANGAGKSTLLKIISRITLPDQGRVIGRGRLASLLEAGVGFHPDLSGRENIFLSGNILGMSNREIRARFDAIVDFADIGPFLDTPVKRYSSGMYIRLAFAIGAFLRPELWIVDEVLSVGDAAFQHKCMHRIREIVREEGTTILLVSHQLSLVSQIASRALWLDEGRLMMDGTPHKVIAAYLQAQSGQVWNWTPQPPVHWHGLQLLGAHLIPQQPNRQGMLTIHTPFTIEIKLLASTPCSGLNICLQLYSLQGECLFEQTTQPIDLQPGRWKLVCTLPGDFLNEGSYYLSLFLTHQDYPDSLQVDACLVFDLTEDATRTAMSRRMGFIVTRFPIHLLADTDP